MKKRRIIFIICFILFASIAAEYFHSTYGLTTTFYTLSSSKITEPVRIVQLSDLHNSEFGKNNSRIIAKVAKAVPDVIFITGDLVNSHSGADTEIATDLISELSLIAPVYFSYGNQEKELESCYMSDISTIYTEADATVLEYSYEDILINDQMIRIGGIYGYCQTEAYASETHREYESEFLEELQNTDSLSLLLCHMPVSWVKGNSLYDWNIDVIFSGHSHGGQIRIPFVGGVWAPDQGWFPGEMCGVYTTTEEEFETYKAKMLKWIAYMKKTGKASDADMSKYEEGGSLEYSPSTLFLSRGLGNTEKVPRFNNVPEIVVVDLLPQ